MRIAKNKKDTVKELGLKSVLQRNRQTQEVVWSFNYSEKGQAGKTDIGSKRATKQTLEKTKEDLKRPSNRNYDKQEDGMGRCKKVGKT